MTKNRLLWAGLVAGACSGWSAAGWAVDEVGAADDSLAEVVVTAEKRSESQQSVPLSMTTFSSAALQEKSINDFLRLRHQGTQSRVRLYGGRCGNRAHDLDSWHLG